MLHSKIFKNKEGWFYLSGKTLETYYKVSTRNTIKIFCEFLQQQDKLDVQKHLWKNKERKPNEYRFKNIFNKTCDDVYIFKLNGDVIQNYYDCLYNFYTLSELKKILKNKEYRRCKKYFQNITS